jgi:hypothetical protein
MTTRKIVHSLLFACFAIIAIPAMHAQVGLSCSNATLNGKYVIAGAGTNVHLDLLGLLEAQQHVEDLGYLVFDGQGNISGGALTETIDNTSTSSTPSGTYSISGGCSGNITLTVNGSARNYSLLTGASQDQVAASFSLGESNGGTDIVLRGSRTFDPAGGCSTTILGGDIGMGDGQGGFGNESVSATAQVVFNTDGTFNLTESGSTNGTITTLQRTGTYAIAPDCTVSLYADEASGGFPVGTLYLEIPQQTTSNAARSLSTNAFDHCAGCKGDLDLTWQPFTNTSEWQPTTFDTGNTNTKLLFF